MFCSVSTFEVWGLNATFVLGWHFTSHLRKAIFKLENNAYEYVSLQNVFRTNPGCSNNLRVQRRCVCSRSTTTSSTTGW